MCCFWHGVTRVIQRLFQPRTNITCVEIEVSLRNHTSIKFDIHFILVWHISIHVSTYMSGKLKMFSYTLCMIQAFQTDVGHSVKVCTMWYVYPFTFYVVRKHKHMFVFSLVCEHCDGWSSRNHSSCKKQTRVSSFVNAMIADDWVPFIARTPTAMVLS